MGRSKHRRIIDDDKLESEEDNDILEELNIMNTSSPTIFEKRKSTPPRQEPETSQKIKKSSINENLHDAQERTSNQSSQKLPSPNFHPTRTTQNPPSPKTVPNRASSSAPKRSQPSQRNSLDNGHNFDSRSSRGNLRTASGTHIQTDPQLRNRSKTAPAHVLSPNSDIDGVAIAHPEFPTTRPDLFSSVSNATFQTHPPQTPVHLRREEPKRPAEHGRQVVPTSPPQKDPFLNRSGSGEAIPTTPNFSLVNSNGLVNSGQSLRHSLTVAGEFELEIAEKNLQHNPYDSLEFCSGYLLNSPNDPRALFLRGRAHMILAGNLSETKKTHLENACCDFASCIEREPENTKALNMLISCELKRAGIPKAITWLQKLIKLTPDSSVTQLENYLKLIECYYPMKDFAPALELLEIIEKKFVKFSSQNPEAYKDLDQFPVYASEIAPEESLEDSQLPSVNTRLAILHIFHTAIVWHVRMMFHNAGAPDLGTLNEELIASQYSQLYNNVISMLEDLSGQIPWSRFLKNMIAEAHLLFKHRLSALQQAQMTLNRYPDDVYSAALLACLYFDDNQKNMTIVQHYLARFRQQSSGELNASNIFQSNRLRCMSSPKLFHLPRILGCCSIDMPKLEDFRDNIEILQHYTNLCNV